MNILPHTMTLRLYTFLGMLLIPLLALASTWTCPMHPQIRDDQPGDCPICGMPLVEEDEADDADAALPPGTLRLSERARSLGRVQTARVEHIPTTRILRLQGKTELDESRVHVFTARVAGRLEKVYIDAPGQSVSQGDPVVEIYSPELIAGFREFLLEPRSRDKMRLLGIDDATLDAVRESGEIPDTLDLPSLRSGVVLERHVREGQNVRVGDPLITLVDLSRVWVFLDAYEADLPWIRPGNEVELEFSNAKGEPVTAEVLRVEPQVNSRTRVARVQLSLDNPDGTFLPGGFVRARLHAEGDTQTVIPATAPLLTGDRAVVYVQVDEDDHIYAPRVIHLGPRVHEGYIVKDGLEEGEIIVARGAFRIDSELQIRGQPSMMTLITDEPPPAPQVDPDTLAHWLNEALNAQRTLAADQWPPDHLHPMPDIEGWDALVEAEDIDQARVALEPVMDFLIRVVEANGLPPDMVLIKAHCPMAFDWEGADWIQEDGPLRNPYFGAEMLECGTPIEDWPPEPAEHPEPTEAPDVHQH